MTTLEVPEDDEPLDEGVLDELATDELDPPEDEAAEPPEDDPPPLDEETEVGAGEDFSDELWWCERADLCAECDGGVTTTFVDPEVLAEVVGL